MALTELARQISEQMIVNVFYTFAKSVERGDFFGVAAAYDVPTAVWTEPNQALCVTAPWLPCTY